MNTMKKLFFLILSILSFNATQAMPEIRFSYYSPQSEFLEDVETNDYLDFYLTFCVTQSLSGFHEFNLNVANENKFNIISTYSKGIMQGKFIYEHLAVFPYTLKNNQVSISIIIKGANSYHLNINKLIKSEELVNYQLGIENERDCANSKKLSDKFILVSTSGVDGQ